MMLPVRAQPLGQLTQSNHPTVKSPNDKMKVPLGVELTCLSMLGSKSTSKSHSRKTKTTVEIELVTEKTERVQSPTGTNNMSTETSQKRKLIGESSNSSPLMSEGLTRSQNKRLSMTCWSITDLKWSASARPSCKAHSILMGSGRSRPWLSAVVAVGMLHEPTPDCSLWRHLGHTSVGLSWNSATNTFRFSTVISNRESNRTWRTEQQEWRRLWGTLSDKTPMLR